MKRIALIGCGKAKQEGRHKTRDLYTGALFRGALAYAEATCDGALVLSAKHHVLELDEEVDYYDLRVPKTVGGQKIWAREVVRKLVLKYAQVNPEPIRFVFLAGADYVEPVTEALHLKPSQFEEPMHGLKLGERLAWLNAQKSSR